jgi:hypothetical protein
VKRPIIVELYGSGVRAVTRHEAEHITYEVFNGEVLVWSRSIHVDRPFQLRVETAREQDQEGTRLARTEGPDRAWSARGASL